ncbi:MAG: hypothetical protein GSR85_07925 [Desulfurococcales archaeon]|nr:hypothetical protein [Desulfurococcales archaeon]
MHGWDELGIPGHAGHSSAAKLLQSALKDLGVRFEAEGDMTRIMLDGAVIEVRDEPGGGYIVLATLSLPAEAGEDPGEYIEAFSRVLGVFMRLRGRIRYELDSSLQDYPMLRIYVIYDDLYQLAEDLVEAVRAVVPH